MDKITEVIWKLNAYKIEVDDQFHVGSVAVYDQERTRTFDVNGGVRVSYGKNIMLLT